MHYNVMSAKADRLVARLGAWGAYQVLCRTPNRPAGTDRDTAMRLVVREIAYQLIPPDHWFATHKAAVKQATPAVRKAGLLAKLGELLSIRPADWDVYHSVQALAILDGSL